MTGPNEGTPDRVLRILVGLVLLYLGLEVITGAAGVAMIIVGAVLALTGFIGWCALYAWLGIDTRGSSPPRRVQ